MTAGKWQMRGWLDMPTCQNCESHVTERYRRVFAPPETPEGEVRVCPQCPDIIRGDGGEIRESRSLRRADTRE